MKQPDKQFDLRAFKDRIGLTIEVEQRQRERAKKITATRTMLRELGIDNETIERHIKPMYYEK